MEHKKFQVGQFVKEIYKGKVGRVTSEITLYDGAQSVKVDFGDGRQLSYSCSALRPVDLDYKPVDASTWNEIGSRADSSIALPSIELTHWVKPYPEGRGDFRNPPKVKKKDVDPAHSNLIRSSSGCLSQPRGSLGARLNFGS